MRCEMFRQRRDFPRSGDMERRKTEEQSAEGIELPEEVMNSLRACGEKYGIDENL